MAPSCFWYANILPGGFQLLHAVYVVERFLENLVKRHCQFHIAFFEGKSSLPLTRILLNFILEHAELCIPPGAPPRLTSRYLLARAVIIRHLTFHLSEAQTNIVVNTFPSLESREFKNYLHVSPIHFVMAHDGASKKAGVPANDLGKCSKVLLRGIIWYFNSHKLNVALVNQIEFRDSKVFTMIVESFTPRAEQKLAMTSKFSSDFEDKRQLLTYIRHGPGGLEDHGAMKNLEIEKLVETCNAEDDLGESSFLIAYAISLMLKKGYCDIFLASAFVLHSVVAKYVPISQRRLPLVTFDKEFEDIIDEFLTTFSEISRPILENTKWIEAIEEEEAEHDTVDLVDGRLFRAVMQAMCEKSVSPLPAAAHNDWRILVRIVKQLSGQDLSIDGSIEPEFSKSTATKDDYEVKSETLSVLPFSSPVFDEHLKCIHVTADTSIAHRVGAMKLYRETSHWHNHRKPLNVKAPTAQIVSKWRYVSTMLYLHVSAANAKQQSSANEPVLYERNDGIRC
jgi:hypothetical protein